MENSINRAEKVLENINKLAAITDHEQAITRFFGSPAFLQANKLLFNWFQQAGLQTRIDSIGNVRGRWNSSNKDARTLVIASHADTVVNAGKFDGPLGILLGLDLVEHLKQKNVSLPFHIELISFSDEEGVRFHTTYLGSKVVAGKFDKELLHKKDADQITLEEAIINMGGEPAGIPTDAIPAKELLGYFEVHIEQGPVLYDSKIPVAAVTSIAGQMRGTVTCTGEAGHAGTVPMERRQDALCCAAECINAIEQFALSTPAVLATVGSLHLKDAASNVIPGQVTFSLDVRSADEDALDTAWQSILALVEKISRRRKITSAIDLVQSSLPVKCDYHLSFLLKRAITAAGQPATELVSGAGHDGVSFNGVTPLCMMFVRCYKGISHNPAEDVELTDLAAAIITGDLFLEQLINYYNQE